ncbi:Rieske 2Fe-2S domain-containing protein [Allocoleopsis sp.]|uniref:aromatic ring-hydroxylating dioxygenase subunit alpha n=1 Tax=Allocoleopsis sp. TaxID=3088169 RepID=UPI002FD0899D
MTLDTQTQDVAKTTAPLAVPENDQTFNWKNCWYPITFLQDLPSSCPYSFSLYDEPFVLFRNQEGKLVCLIDRCPHRAAKLSDGQLIDGKIECLYHGWQFGSEGECLHIPQLPTDAKIPTNACVKSFKVVERQGIVWMWRGEPESADDDRIPAIAELDQPGFLVSSDYMSDRPYDQTYFIENVIDPAHFPISHHGSLSNRQNAQPLEMEVLNTSVEGIRGRVRETRSASENWLDLDFVAPNLVAYRFDLPMPGLMGGAAIYSLPLGKGRCRVLLRNYQNFSTRKIKLKPRWLEHLFRNRVSEEDMPFIRGQQAHIERLGKNPNSLYLPLKTSDTLLIEYRKWLDKYGSSLPFYQGYTTSKPGVLNSEGTPPSVLVDRLRRHTQLCSSCNRAYQVTNKLKQTLVGVAIGMAALAIVTDAFWGRIGALSASVSAVALAFIAEKVKTRFERSYERH